MNNENGWWKQPLGTDRKHRPQRRESAVKSQKENVSALWGSRELATHQFWDFLRPPVNNPAVMILMHSTLGP